jgi:glycosyltransferase involved in cell wall biosynthesis
VVTVRPPRALIIVQNLPVPFDRRVWLECLALRGAGWEIAVVCPKGKGDPRHHVIDGVQIYKYRPYPPAQRRLAFVLEYIYSFVMTAWLSWKVWRRHGFDVVQACNPPDIFWPIGLVCRATSGTRFVFDQHDLCPELYQSRFPDGAQLPLHGLRVLERCTYRTADRVISTNESYRRVAIERGGKRPEDVTVVRTGPDPERLRRDRPTPSLRRGRRFLVSYIGVMAPQDGVDIVLRAADIVVHDFGRTDVSFTLIGAGDSFDELLALREQLGLGDYVEFTGRVPDDVVRSVMSSSDLGLCPDPKNPLNDVSTMNKTMEYMAFSLPVVAFDLRETRVSAGDAAVYVQPNDERAYARAIVQLLDDEERRQTMGALGRARVEDVLAWRHQSAAYVEVYNRLVGIAPQLICLPDAMADALPDAMQTVRD